MWALRVQEQWRGKWADPETGKASMEKAVGLFPAQKQLWTTWTQLARHAPSQKSEEETIKAVSAVFERAVNDTPSTTHQDSS